MDNFEHFILIVKHKDIVVLVFESFQYYLSAKPNRQQLTYLKGAPDLSFLLHNENISCSAQRKTNTEMIPMSIHNVDYLEEN